jgi:hypothetical protein
MDWEEARVEGTFGYFTDFVLEWKIGKNDGIVKT